MPLHDHFHLPLYPQRSWESFHSRWANSIADELHRVLPHYFTAVAWTKDSEQPEWAGFF